MILKTRPDSYGYHTGVHTEHLYSASQLLSSIITFGRNRIRRSWDATRRARGGDSPGRLPQGKDDVRDHRSRPVGVPEGKLVLGKHSGRHALGQRAKELGYDLTREELNDLYKRFMDVADHRKKGLMDEEIVSLIQTSREEALKVAAD
jgi:2-isopropylmalate synthase